jgi:arabinofuranan 3-O-arabinosyltransferase
VITNPHHAVRHNLSGPYSVVLIASVLLGVWLSLSILPAFLSPGIDASLADKDFANYWIAGRMVLGGAAGDLFGPQPIYFAHMQAVFGEGYPWHNWSYPPHILLFIWPLGLAGYKSAMLGFLAMTAVFFAWAMREFAGRLTPVAWVAIGPLLVHNFQFAQNGFLTAGLGLSALAFRERRPVLAGFLLGLLTVKPQLGILFPFLLIAERRWTMIASAAATTLLLILASGAIFGIEVWQSYLADVVPYQNHVMRHLDGSFLAMQPSVDGMLRNWTLSPDTALLAHCVLALPVAALAIAAFFWIEGARERGIVLLVATFLVTPYSLSYDLGLFEAAVALMAAADGRWQSLNSGRKWLMVTAMLLPVLMIPLGQLHITIAPLIILAVFALALGETGLARSWRRPGSTETRSGVTPSSPAAASN